MFKLSLTLSGAFVLGLPNIVSYCDLLESKCGKWHSITSAQCQATMSNTTVGDDGDGAKDTLGCRLKYLNDPAFNSTESCRYAGPSGGGRCGSVVSAVCRAATQVCTGIPNASYTDAAACEAAYVAEGLSAQWGSKQGSSAGTEDSLECRIYHAYTSIALPDGGHCTHWSAKSSQCKDAIVGSPVHYCELLEFNCNTSDTSIRQFTSKDQCLAVAGGYTGSNDARASNGGNNLGCRIYHATAAKVIGTEHCGHAGPSGGGVCGSYLEAWSSLLSAAPCSDTTVQSVVKIVNPAFLDAAVPRGYRTAAKDAAYTPDLDTGGNTQACRIYHLTVASAGGATAVTHCPHGTLSGGGACGTNLVSNLCKVIEQACPFGSDSTYQFASLTSCTEALANSTAYPIALGAATDTDKNSYACRFYHAGVAASYLTGGANFNTTGAAANNKLHCSHIIKMPTAVGGCGSSSVTPPKPSSASTLSVFLSAFAVAFAALSL